MAFLFLPVIGDSVRPASDIGMYAQTFLLSLQAHGLGGVPQTVLGFYADTVRQVLNVSVDNKLLFGYPRLDSPANQLRMGRCDLAESVTFHA